MQVVAAEASSLLDQMPAVRSRGPIDPWHLQQLESAAGELGVVRERFVSRLRSCRLLLELAADLIERLAQLERTLERTMQTYNALPAPTLESSELPDVERLQSTVERLRREAAADWQEMERSFASLAAQADGIVQRIRLQVPAPASIRRRGLFIPDC